MENTTYRVNVTSPGLSVYFKNRVCRTPVVFESVHEFELKILESQLKQKSMKYNVEKNVTKATILPDEIFDEVAEENKEVKVEELYLKEKKKSESILDKLIAEDQ